MKLDHFAFGKFPLWADYMPILGEAIPQVLVLKTELFKLFDCVIEYQLANNNHLPLLLPQSLYVIDKQSFTEVQIVQSKDKVGRVFPLFCGTVHQQRDLAWVKSHGSSSELVKGLESSISLEQFEDSLELFEPQAAEIFMGKELTYQNFIDQAGDALAQSILSSLLAFRLQAGKSLVSVLSLPQEAFEYMPYLSYFWSLLCPEKTLYVFQGAKSLIMASTPLGNDFSLALFCGMPLPPCDLSRLTSRDQAYKKCIEALKNGETYVEPRRNKIVQYCSKLFRS